MARAPAKKPQSLEWRLIRGAVRAAREHCVKGGVRWSRQRLAQHSGVDAATIFRVESVARYPDYRPDLETIARLVWTLDLTLSQLFADVEDQMSTIRGSSRAKTKAKPAPLRRGRRVAVHPEVASLIDDTVASVSNQLLDRVDVAVDRAITRTFGRLGSRR
jgi:hypothetical protein